MIARISAALLAATLVAAPSSAATLIYSFTTTTTAVPGDVTFTFESEAPPPFDSFIEASALTSASLGIQRIRFTDACFFFTPGAPSSTACDIVEVVVENGGQSFLLGRFFEDGALQTAGDFASIRAQSARLTVTAAAAAVPEPASWAMMIAGFGLAGTAVRRRKETLATA